MTSGDDKPTRNPNFGRTFCFERVKLKRDMLLWPNLVVKVFERGFNYPETKHLVLPTFLFADFLKKTNHDSAMQQIQVSLAIFMNNLGVENQRQENPLRIFMNSLMEQL